MIDNNLALFESLDDHTKDYLLVYQLEEQSETPCIYLSRFLELIRDGDQHFVEFEPISVTFGSSPSFNEIFDAVLEGTDESYAKLDENTVELKLDPTVNKLEINKMLGVVVTILPR